MSKLVISYRGTVYPWQCDHMGHMNVMWYTGKFDEASWHFLSRIGMTHQYLRERHAGIVAVQQNISFKRELRAGDIITIRSAVIEVREKTIKFFHELTNDQSGEVAAVGEMTGVYLDLSRRRARPIPLEIADQARNLMLDVVCLSEDPPPESLAGKSGSHHEASTADLGWAT